MPLGGGGRFIFVSYRINPYNDQFFFLFSFTFSYISLDQNNKQQCFPVIKLLLPIVSHEHHMHTCNREIRHDISPYMIL